MKIFKKILKISFILVMILILLIGIFSIFLRTRPAEKMPIIGGYKPLNVLGGSMEPTIKLGSVVLVKKVNAGDIKIGDIITFKPATNLNNSIESQTMITHRVVKIFKEKGSIGFETKGDANKTSDGNQIRENEIIGKVVLSVPYIGKLSLFVKSRNGFLLLILLPGLAIILVEIGNIFKQLKGIKKERSA